MNYSLQYMCYLVQTKNDLNRKRRRFWHLKPKSKYIGWDANSKAMYAVYASPYPYEEGEAEAGYERAKKQMKSMTKLMRKVRKELNARHIWSWHGAIRAIKHEGKYYSEADIRRLADHHIADSILLKGREGT